MSETSEFVPMLKYIFRKKNDLHLVRCGAVILNNMLQNIAVLNAILAADVFANLCKVLYQRSKTDIASKCVQREVALVMYKLTGSIDHQLQFEASNIQTIQKALKKIRTSEEPADKATLTTIESTLANLTVL